MRSLITLDIREFDDLENIEAAAREFMPFAQVAFLWTKDLPPEEEVQKYRDAYWKLKEALLKRGFGYERP